MSSGAPSLRYVRDRHELCAGCAGCDERGFMKLLIMAVVLVMSTVAFAQDKTSPGAGPSIVVVETEKGTFEFETYPNEAPKTVAHILDLINKHFYNGQRVHRVVPGFVM